MRGHEAVAQPTAFEASADATAPQEQAPTETALESTVAPETSKVAVPQPAEPGVRRMRILAAEDNRTNRFALEKVLRALNIGLAFAEDILAAGINDYLNKPLIKLIDPILTAQPLDVVPYLPMAVEEPEAERAREHVALVTI